MHMVATVAGTMAAGVGPVMAMAMALEDIPTTDTVLALVTHMILDMDTVLDIHTGVATATGIAMADMADTADIGDNQ